MKEFYIELEAWRGRHQDGWATFEKMETLVGAVFALRPNRIMEIGVWAGASFIPMSLALKRVKGTGRIIGIDPWDSKASAEGLTGQDQDWWAKADHERIYSDFQKSIAETGVGPWVEVFRQRSDQYKIKDDLVIDLLHIDGNHGEEASLYDVNNFATRVRVGGFLFMDDVHWAAKAAEAIPKLGFQELFRQDTGVFYQRMRI